MSLTEVHLVIFKMVKDAFSLSIDKHGIDNGISRTFIKIWLFKILRNIFPISQGSLMIFGIAIDRSDPAYHREGEEEAQNTCAPNS